MPRSTDSVASSCSSASRDGSIPNPPTSAHGNSRQHPGSLGGPEKAGATPWLDAWHEPSAGMVCFSQFMTAADIRGDGDARLIVVDLNKNVKVFKGTDVEWEHRLVMPPVAVRVYYRENGNNTIPFLAVASAHNIFIYRHLKPHAKFCLPPTVLHPDEISAWHDFSHDEIDSSLLCQRLTLIREAGKPLSSISVSVLATEPSKQEAEIAEALPHIGGERHVDYPAITCMEVLQHRSCGPRLSSMLVVGAENSFVYILSSKADCILSPHRFDAVPSFMVCLGTYESDYRIVVACRNSRIYTIKNGVVLSTAIELDAPCVAMASAGKVLHVACMDDTVSTFFFKGKKKQTIVLDHPITNMCVVSVNSPRVTKTPVIALANGEVRVYSGKALVHSFHTRESIVGMIFGQFGREEGCLILSFATGGLMVKILGRLATLDAPESSTTSSAQDVPLKVPRKSQLYVDQCQREREQAANMHHVFQRDLCALRLESSRAYVTLLLNSRIGTSSSLRTTCVVAGQGPTFTLCVTLANTGSSCLSDLYMAISANKEWYEIDKPLVPVPLILPHMSHVVCICVKSLTAGTEKVVKDVVNIFIGNGRGGVPLGALQIALPLSQPPLVT